MQDHNDMDDAVATAGAGDAATASVGELIKLVTSGDTKAVTELITRADADEEALQATGELMKQGNQKVLKEAVARVATGKEGGEGRLASRVRDAVREFTNQAKKGQATALVALVTCAEAGNTEALRAVISCAESGNPTAWQGAVSHANRGNKDAISLLIGHPDKVDEAALYGQVALAKEGKEGSDLAWTVVMQQARRGMRAAVSLVVDRAETGDETALRALMGFARPDHPDAWGVVVRKAHQGMHEAITLVTQRANAGSTGEISRLIEAAEQGNAKEFQVVALHAKLGRRYLIDYIVAEHRPQLMAYCRRRLGNQADAEDACGITLGRAYLKLHEFRGDSRLQTWIFGIAKVVTWEEIKRRMARLAREARILLGETGVVGGEWTLLDGMAERFSPEMEAILAELTRDQRQVLWCRFSLEMANQEIARMIGITENAVATRNKRALEAARRAAAKLYPDWPPTRSGNDGRPIETDERGRPLQDVGGGDRQAPGGSISPAADDAASKGSCDGPKE